MSTLNKPVINEPIINNPKFIGTTSVMDNVNITGDTNIGGITNMTGGANFGGNIIMTGETTVSGTTNLVGTTNLADVVTMNGTLNVGGLTYIAGTNTISGKSNIVGTTKISGDALTIYDIGSFDIKANTNMNSYRITQVGTPIDHEDAATKLYVDTAVAGLDPSDPNLLVNVLTYNESIKQKNGTLSIDENGNIDTCGNIIMDGSITVNGNTNVNNLTTGNIDIQGNRILNIASPTEDTDVTTKLYVDNVINDVSHNHDDLSVNTITYSVRIKQDNNTFSVDESGNILSSGRMGLGDISNPIDTLELEGRIYIQDPDDPKVFFGDSTNYGSDIGFQDLGTAAEEFIIQNYRSGTSMKLKTVNDIILEPDNTVQIETDVSINGVLSMMSHKIVDVDTPTDGSDAANKSYVDNAVAGIGGGGTADLSVDTLEFKTELKQEDGNFTVQGNGDINTNGRMNVNGISSNDDISVTGMVSAVTLESTDDIQLFGSAFRVALGENISYIQGGDITKGQSGVIRFTKWQSEDKVIDIDTTHNILDVSAVTIKTNNYTDLDTQVKTNETSISNKLDISGGTMTGSLNMDGNKITNVGEPVDDSDVATKAYVDSNSGGGTIGSDISVNTLTYSTSISQTDGFFQVDASGNVYIRGELDVSNVNVGFGIKNYPTENTTGEDIILSNVKIGNNAYSPQFISAYKNGLEIDGQDLIVRTSGIDKITDASEVPNRMVIKGKTGRVGINTDEPATTLDVSGNTNISGSLNVNNANLLVTDASGTQIKNKLEILQNETSQLLNGIEAGQLQVDKWIFDGAGGLYIKTIDDSGPPTTFKNIMVLENDNVAVDGLFKSDNITFNDATYQNPINTNVTGKATISIIPEVNNTTASKLGATLNFNVEGEYENDSSVTSFVKKTMCFMTSDNPQATKALNFTGQHRTLFDSNHRTNVLNMDPSLNEDISENILRGFIVSSTGRYVDNLIEINEAIPYIEFSNSAKDKRIYGVLADAEDISGTTREFSHGALTSLFDRNSKVDHRVSVNSIGEGAIWVCDMKYDGSDGEIIENGDYITASPIPGIGMLQTEEYLAKYTVAKATCDCSFNDETIAVQDFSKNEVTGEPILDASGDYIFYNTGETVSKFNEKVVEITGTGYTIYNDVAKTDAFYQHAFDFANGTPIQQAIVGKTFKMAFIGCTYHCG